MQSCSKPFTYGICLNELGPDIVHRYVGHEPSGRNFNEICLDSNSEFIYFLQLMLYILMLKSFYLKKL